MKSKFLAGLILALVAVAAVVAADLTYTSLPQTGDSDLVIRNKASVAMAKLEHGNSFTNISAAGTNNISGPVVLDRLVIGTGTANATVTLSEVTASATNAIGTFSAASQAALPLGTRVEGTLRVVTVGTPNLTLSYR